MNNLLLLGTIAVPPVYYCTEKGQDLTRLQITSSTQFEGRHITVTHHCQAWGPAALNLHEYLKVGDRLLVRGELRYRLRDIGDGQQVNVPVIHIKSYSFLGEGEIVSPE